MYARKLPPTVVAAFAGRIDTYGGLSNELKSKGYFLTTDADLYDLYVQKGSCKGAKLQWQGDDGLNLFRVAYFTRDEVMAMAPPAVNLYLERFE